MKKYLLLGIASLIILTFLILFQSLKLGDGKLHMVVCDIGQGDAIFIRTEKGADILIDGGPDDKVLDCLGSHMPFWDRKIEVLILTHPDADHLRGLVSVIDRYRVDHFVTINIPKSTSVYKLMQGKLKNKNITPKYLFAGDKINLGKTSLVLYWPEKEYFLQNSQNAEKGTLGANDFAIVSKLVYGQFSALLTADAGSNIQDRIAAKIGDIEVLKVPHHGSKTGMSDLFLSETTPELAIVSVGKNNSYGHPTQIMLDLLSRFKAKALRTDLDGEIEVITDGESYWID